MPIFLAMLRSLECSLFQKVQPLAAPVLDIGCGDGFFASVAFKESLFSGIDPDISTIHEAKNINSYNYIIAARASDIPFRTGSFNTIISNSVLEHIEDLDDTLDEIYRVLLPNGSLYFTIPSQYFGEMLLGTTFFRTLGLEKYANMYSKWFNHHSKHFHIDNPETWIKRLNKHGFHVENWKYYFTPAAHRIFDLMHYLSLPRLVTKKTTGKWVLFPDSILNKFLTDWLSTLINESSLEKGAYIFFKARKGSGK